MCVNIVTTNILFQADLLRKAVEEGEDPTAPAIVTEEE